jgi:hypothetical protein
VALPDVLMVPVGDDLVDDKLRILTAVKRVWGTRLTTVFPRQGHYAHALDVATCPAGRRDDRTHW